MPDEDPGVAQGDRRRGDGDQRGPGGHILTGPVYVEGARAGRRARGEDPVDRSADRLRLQRLQRLPARELRRAGATTMIMPLDRKTMTATFAPGIVIPLQPFFGSMGVAPAPEVGRVSSNPPGTHAGNLDNTELVAGTTLFIPGVRGGRAVRGRRRPRRAGRRRGRSDRDRDVAARPAAADRAQGHEAGLAARRDGHRLHQHGHRPRPHEGDAGPPSRR